MPKNKRIPQLLILYYGVLQSLHLLVLLRAGILLLTTSTIPFPILPPSTGWQAQTWPFLLGLAGIDVIGILLGIIFAVRSQFKGVVDQKLGLISLTIFISGAIIFAAGTFPSGAWSQHPIAYWGMALLFLPCPYLFYQLITMPLENESPNEPTP
jgi:hypothetical protein